jgi:hypothetical protein
MRPKLRTAADFAEEARGYAVVLVDQEKARTGSRMTAYSSVAAAVGVSSRWLRKLVGRQPGVDLGAHEHWNIKAAYDAICERVEASAAIKRERAAALRRILDAAGQSGDRVDSRVARPEDG